MGVMTWLSKAVEIHIDELVLEGVSADPDRIRAAVARELGRLLEGNAQPAAALPGGDDGDAIGARVATSIHGRLEP